MQPLFGAVYNSVAEFIADSHGNKIRNAKANGKVHKYYAFDNHRNGWLGADVTNGADVLRLMRNGWPEGRARLDAFRATLSAPDVAPTDRRRRMVRGPMGDSLDIHAVYGGRLDIAWTAARRRSFVAPQRVDILSSFTAAGSERADVLFWRGAAVAALCDVLEAAGYMVKIAVGQETVTSKSEEKIKYRITLKDHDRPLDIATISASLLPGFSRSCMLSWVAAHASHAIGFGVSKSGRDMKPEPGEIYCGHSVRDKHSAREWVNAQISKLETGAVNVA